MDVIKTTSDVKDKPMLLHYKALRCILFNLMAGAQTIQIRGAAKASAHRQHVAEIS